MLKDNLTYKLLKGQEILAYLPDLASLRISVFNEYPYLYLGNDEYEKNYLSTYANCEDFVLLIVLDNTNVVGITTGIPMRYEEDNFKKIFNNSEFNINEVFYIGETILLPEYRNQGISKLMLSTVEQQALEQGYRVLSLATVHREENDPRRPKGYKPLDSLWQKFGYECRQDMIAGLSWQEIGQDDVTVHEMMFWLKLI